MNEVIITKINSSYVHVEADDDILHEINDYFAVFAEGYMFSPRYKARIWDGKDRFFSILHHTLPAGLLQTLEKFCKKNNYEIKYESFDDFESEYTDESFEKNCAEALRNTGMKMRDYQEAACKLALQKKIGILQCCTSSGKSMIIYNMIRNMLTYKRIKKILLIVPSVSLVEQMHSDFKDYGWNEVDDYVTLKYAGKEFDNTMPVMISTWQSLQKIEDNEFFEDFDAVIVDECHRIKS